MTDVLITGASGRAGDALIEHLSGEYNFTYLDRRDVDEYDAHVADITEFDEIRPAFRGQDAVVHLAAEPRVEASWNQVLQNNIVGLHNALEAARTEDVSMFVFASSNHVVGGYESEFAPEIYDEEFGMVVDHTDPVRPDSFYGSSKVFGEAMGRQYTDQFEFPRRFYALRIGSLREPAYDHPFGDAEKGVDEGQWERDSEEYERSVRRMKATWLSRRDFAQLVDCCLRDEDSRFGVYYGVSDNAARWFDLEQARADIGYRPVDRAEEWETPPESNSTE